MASSNHIVTLSVGTQRVSGAVFAQSKKGSLILNKFASQSILADPSNENARMSQIVAAIAQVASALKADKNPVYYSLPGYSVFVRFIKLPPIDNGDIDQLIQFEAQQHIPFPLEEVIWSYHMLPDSGLEKEAVLIAIKADLLNEIDGAITAPGMKTAGVDCSPTALYNAFCNSYPDLTESVLLIDIGAKTSNLVFSENGRFFTRSVSMGGTSVTAAIAREYNISFAEAENLKVTKGLIALSGGHTSSMDENTARLATCIRNAMTRLVAEIPRTTNHYRSQYGGEAPKQIFLCGGGAALAYTREFIQERLNIPVQFLNPIHNVTMGKSVNTDVLSREAYLLGELVGLGLKATGQARIKIDLIPLSVAKAKESRKKLPFVIFGMTALVAASGIAAWASVDNLEKALTARDQEIDIQSAADKAQTKIDKTVKTEKEIDEKLGQYRKLTDTRFAFINVLSDLVKRAPSDSYWIVEFDPLIGFDKNNPDSITTGTSAINKGFKTDKSLSLSKVDPIEEQQSSGKKGSAQKKQVRTINAIKFRGLVRMSSDKLGYQSADWIRNKLQESPYFDFTINGKPLEARQIIKFDDKPEEKDAFAKPFTMVLPLKNPIPVE